MRGSVCWLVQLDSRFADRSGAAKNIRLRWVGETETIVVSLLGGGGCGVEAPRRAGVSCWGIMSRADVPGTTHVKEGVV